MGSSTVVSNRAKNVPSKADITSVNSGNISVPKTKNRHASGWESPPPQKLELNVNIEGPVIHIPSTAKAACDSRLSRNIDGHRNVRKNRIVVTGKRIVRPITTNPENRYAIIQWATTLGVQNTSPPSSA